MRALLLIAATAAFLVCLHEAGHIAAGWATGGRVTYLKLLALKPTVRISGAATDQVNATRALAGSAFVVTFGAAAALLLPLRGPLSAVRETACFFGAVELLAWFLSSALHRIQSQGNDVSLFLELTGVPPLVVAAASLLLALAGWGTILLRNRSLPAVAAPDYLLRRA